MAPAALGEHLPASRGTSVSVAAGLVAAAVLAACLAAEGLRRGLTCPWFALDIYDPMAIADVVALVAYQYLRPVPAMLLAAATPLILKHPTLPRAATVAWLAVMSCMALALAIGGAYMARDVLQCGLVFCFGQDTHGPSGGDGMGLRAHEGLLSLGLGLTMSVAWLLLLVRLVGGGSREGWAAELQEDALSAGLLDGEPLAARLHQLPAKRQQTRRRREACAASALALVVVPGSFLLTAILPNNFQKLHLTGGEESYRLPNQMAAEMLDAEVPGAWMRTLNWRVSEQLVLKFYPDTMLFYGFLEALAATAMLGAWVPAARRGLAMRRPGGLSIGEGLALALAATMIAGYAFYWAHEHAWGHIGWKFNSHAWEVPARVCGMMAVLFMSLCLLPASKSSLWLEALGMSWETGLWAHRWLGGAALVMVVAHILFFWAVWHYMGIFPHDVMSYPMYYPLAPFTAIDWGKPGGADMTIEMMQFIGYPGIIMMGLPPLVRRKHYEVFKYLHYMFLVLVPMTMVHAHNAWYFLFGGATFWLADAGMRLVSAASTCALVSAQAHEAEGGVTELRFEKAFAEPGAYCFVNVPELSLWEWHPFSLSSSPLDRTASMHIRNMGPGTFTSRLHELAKERRPFALNVDGPYGPALHVGGHGALLLLAGGIGVTPLHGTFRYLQQLARLGQAPVGLRRVHLVFVARSVAVLDLFAESLREATEGEARQEIRFSAALHFTHRPGTGPPLPLALAGWPLSAGRPAPGELYAELLRELEPGVTLLAKACAPAELDAAAAVAARRCGGRVAYESERFVI